LTILRKAFQVTQVTTLERESMTPAEILRELARHDIFPREAMAAARAHRDVMSPIFVDVVERLGTLDRLAMDEGEITALIPIFHLLGEFQEQRAYRPLLKLLRQPTDTLDYLLGDAVTETSFRVVAGAFAGDLQPLFDFIEDAAADVFARSSMMDALVLIALRHPEKRDVIKGYFRDFRRRCKDQDADLLIAWMEALADMGLSDMAPEIRAAFEAGLIPSDYCAADDVIGDLEANAVSGKFAANPRYQSGLISDAIGELSKWHGYSDAYLAKQKRLATRNPSRTMPWAETFAHKSPHFGRNDPCPCGSGKKFKKCCL
jgi:hypothetical protein